MRCIWLYMLVHLLFLLDPLKLFCTEYATLRMVDIVHRVSSMMVAYVTRTRVLSCALVRAHRLRLVYLVDPKRQDRYPSQRNGSTFPI